MGVSDHCVVWMNQTKILLMGGYTESEGYSENTLIYDFKIHQWIKGPSMKEKRILFGCGTFYSIFHAKFMIIAIGGYNSDYLNTVELLDANAENWFEGRYIRLVL